MVKFYPAAAIDNFLTFAMGNYALSAVARECLALANGCRSRPAAFGRLCWKSWFA